MDNETRGIMPPKPSWAEVQNAIIRQAQLLHSQVLSMQGKYPNAELLYEAMGEVDRTKISGTQALARFIWRNLPPDIKEATKARLAEGILGIIAHSWFVIELDDPQAPPGLKYIVDPCSPGVIPSAILLGPGSPFQIQYQERKIDNQEGS